MHFRLGYINFTFITCGCPCSQGRRNSGKGRGAVKKLSAVETYKKQTNLYHYACLCSTTIMTSKIITEIIDNLLNFIVVRIAAKNLFRVDLDKPCAVINHVTVMKKEPPSPFPPFERSGDNAPAIFPFIPACSRTL